MESSEEDDLRGWPSPMKTAGSAWPASLPLGTSGPLRGGSVDQRSAAHDHTHSSLAHAGMVHGRKKEKESMGQVRGPPENVRHPPNVRPQQLLKMASAVWRARCESPRFRSLEGTVKVRAKEGISIAKRVEEEQTAPKIPRVRRALGKMPTRKCGGTTRVRVRKLVAVVGTSEENRGRGKVYGYLSRLTCESGIGNRCRGRPRHRRDPMRGRQCTPAKIHNPVSLVRLSSEARKEERGGLTRR